KDAPSTVPSSTAAARALTCSMFMKQLCITYIFCCFPSLRSVPTVGSVLTHLVAGLLTGCSLIIAVGPQNALILRQGIRREHLGVGVGICILADVLLLGAGTVGIGAIVRLAPWALEVLRWRGAAYLLWSAWTSLRSARTASGREGDTRPRSQKSSGLH